jgi:choline dehydrogenase
MSNGKAKFNPFAQQDAHTAELAERVRANQERLTSELRPRYDFIVCASGSSGSVVARRLAENADVNVLLLGAGGSDELPCIMDPSRWFLNLGSERDWAFVAQPNSHLNGRSIPLNMGKVLGGGSSINVMCWARGHKNDWDFFAAEARDPCPCRKLDPDVLVVQSAQEWHGQNTADGLDRAGYRRILIQG